MALNFRLASEHDIPRVVAILTECAIYTQKFEVDNAWPIPYPVEEITAAVKQGQTYVVESDEKQVVATFRLIFSDPEFWGWLEEIEKEARKVTYLHKLAVSRAFTHQGIGEAIMEWVEDFAKMNICFCIRLDCSATNQFIQKYYEAKGFKRIRTVNIVREGKKRQYLLMEKPLQIFAPSQ